MRKARFVLGLALLVAASLYLLPALQAADEPIPDSPEVSEKLVLAKMPAAQLTKDADYMFTFRTSELTEVSHAVQLNMMRDSLNELGEYLEEMGSRREWASPWQQQAIDRILPLGRELATKLEATIEYLNNNPNRLHAPEYRDSLRSNFELASTLSKRISKYAAYAANKTRADNLGYKLEAPNY